MQKANRKGAARVSEVDSDVLISLEKGILETKSLSEMFAIHLATLLSNTFPELPAESIHLVEKAKAEGFLAKITLCANILADYWKKDLSQGIAKCSSHSSDIVRGFACYMIGNRKDSSLEQDFLDIRPFADDSHFGVREWAWLGMRGKIIADPEKALALLLPWAKETSPNIRRFSSESTRPRGVWCSHINLFKTHPEKALSLLELLYSDETKYVRDSVGNWLNDASKTQAEWVKHTCATWEEQNPTKETREICKRALRSINKKALNK